MRQITQSGKTGELTLSAIPDPVARAGHVLVVNEYSVVSPGTERASIESAKRSLLTKARSRPDLVKQMLGKMKKDGIIATIAGTLDRMDQSIPLGYSSAGTVLAVGKGVHGFSPGDRVASNGAHAQIVSVPQHLCAHVPKDLSLESAAYGILASIALNAVRLAKLGIGESALVIGLGLVGQLAVALLRVQGCRVFGIDLDEDRCKLASKMGAECASPEIDSKEIYLRTRGVGADAVLIAASTPSDLPVELAAEAVRQKGRIVAIGSVGMNLPRKPLYFKEAEFVVSCSYGPGRYDPEYEDRGKDYPVGHVRWTEQRNLHSVLELMASKHLDVSPLTTHRFPLEDAVKAYELVQGGKEISLGIVLEYPPLIPTSSSRRMERVSKPRSSGRIGVGVIGVGNFAKATLLPLLKRTRAFQARSLCASAGLAVSHAAEKFDFEVATTDENEILSDPKVEVVFIVTRHDQHASQILKCLSSGKHVFVEKPLAITEEEVAAIDEQMRGQGPILMVGYNRRFSPYAKSVRALFASSPVPLTVSIRMNAGPVQPDHWTQSELEGGGRIIGEACHAIDLATYLAGSRPVRVFAECIGGPSVPVISEDQTFITLRHENGAVSSIGYLAGGDVAFGKERVEVIGAGKVAVIDDFRELRTSMEGKIRIDKQWHQDKGHGNEIAAFGDALTKGAPSPIPWDELRSVSLASILAVRSLREGVPFEVP